MKENIKNVLLMGLGAISLTGEIASELKKELLEKGETLYKEGSIKNEELKRDIKEKIKENTSIEVTTASKEDIVEIIKNMTDEEKAEITELLKNNENSNIDDEKDETSEEKNENDEQQNENN